MAVPRISARRALNRHARATGAFEGPFSAKLAAWLTRFGRLLADEAIEEMGLLSKSHARVVAKASIWELLKSDLHNLFFGFGMRSMQRAGERATGAKWQVPPLMQQQFAEQKQVLLQGLMDDTREAARESVRVIIQEATVADVKRSPQEIARRIRRQFHGPANGRQELFSPERAELIARTELVQSQNSGTAAALEEAGVEEIEWVAFTDGKSGDRHHERMHGKRIQVGGMFETPLGNRLRYPGDPRGPIKETARCRCGIKPVI